MPRDNYDKPKKSWREIDQSKDGSKHRPADRPQMNKNAQERSESASKSYRAKLDSFFDGEGKAPAHVKEKFQGLKDTSKEGLERQKAIAEIKDAGTSSAVDKALEAYLGRWELPPDYEVLASVLISSDEENVSRALQMLEEMLSNKHTPRRTEVLEQRLRRVKSLADDPDLADRAGEVLTQLRLFK